MTNLQRLAVRLALSLTAIAISQSISSQVYFDVDQSVKMTAQANAANGSITVRWIQDPRTLGYDLYRRRYSDTDWGPKIASYPPEVTEYLDTAIVPAKLYEYKIIKYVEGVEGYGYALSAINLPAAHHQGRVLLVITEPTYNEIATKLEEYTSVIESDGWTTQLLRIPSALPVSQIKEEMQDIYAMQPYDACLLLGDVPNAHSGDINPDAHNEHKGAWAADIYYGDMDGIWTDTFVSNVTSDFPINHNIPGDEKWDQSYLPSDVEVAVGRVDFSDLPVFDEDEYELLRRYLDKDIRYRTKDFTVPKRAAMRNVNSWIGALGQNGIRNFSTLVGPENISYGEIAPVWEESYEWFYGACAGNHDFSFMMSSSAEFAQDSFQSIFTAWFGSRFGDYDFENNYLRSSLGSGTVLSSCWAGAPHWHFHAMAMGYPLSHATVTTQNNDTIYTADFFPRGVHVNLLGDPTLKSFIVAPPAGLSAQETLTSVDLQWQESPDSDVLGYHIYRRSHPDSSFLLLNPEPVSQALFSDDCPPTGQTYTYLVRAVKLETSPTGTFYNLSSGTTRDISITSDREVDALFTGIRVGNELIIENQSSNATDYFWSFANGTSVDINPTITADTDEDTEVTLIASNLCDSDTLTLVFPLLSDTSPTDPPVKIYPNPTSEHVQISTLENIESIEIYLNGSKVNTLSIANPSNSVSVDVSDLKAGTYQVIISTRVYKTTSKLLIIR